MIPDSSPQMMNPDSDPLFQKVPNESGVKSHDFWFVHSLVFLERTGRKIPFHADAAAGAAPDAPSLLLPLSAPHRQHRTGSSADSFQSVLILQF